MSHHTRNRLHHLRNKANRTLTPADWQAIEEVGSDADARIAELEAERNAFVEEINVLGRTSTNLEVENERLRRRVEALGEGVKAAIDTIKVWHNMGMGNGPTEEEAWQLYLTSPEMQLLTSALNPNTETDNDD